MSVAYQLERDRAYKGLLDLFLGGSVDPDLPLSERKLAGSLDMGRTPVREALRDLARDGLIEVRPARGTFVKRLTSADIREIYQVRQSLESLAARLAAENGGSPALSAYGPRFEHMIARPGDFDLAETYEFGAAFHTEVFRAAGNAYLLGLYEPMRLQFSVALGLPRFYDPDWVRQSVPEHLMILNTIERGDGAAAGQLISDHLGHGMNVRARIFDRLADIAETGG